jgi:CBS domain containing-hemolysin-like protein
LVAFFVGFGISAFYQAPDRPPLAFAEVDAAQKAENPTQEQKQLLSERRQSWKAYHQQVSDYNKVVSSIAIGVAVVLLGGSILWLSSLAVIGDGVTLGAVFTLFYGLIRANMTDSEVFRFVAVAVGLVVVIGLVYVRFVRPGSRGTGPPQGTEALGT